MFGEHGARPQARRALAGRASCPQWLCGRGLLVCVLRGFGSQLAVWRLLSERRLWFFPRFPVTDQAVYKRLHSAGTKPLERLFEQISGVLAERLQGVVSEKLAPFAEGVVCIDESTLDAMSRRLPPSESDSPRRQSSAPWQAGWRVRRERPAVADRHVSAGPTSEREGVGAGAGGRSASGNTGGGRLDSLVRSHGRGHWKREIIGAGKVEERTLRSR